jgi:hypothetical protein
MSGITDLNVLIENMTPILNDGEYVFVQIDDLNEIDRHLTLFEFKEQEGYTVVIAKELADQQDLSYDFTASWITLSVNSSLEAVGLTAAFSKALSDHGISCNVVAAFSHDHIFVPKEAGEKTMKVLNHLSV